MSSQTISTEHLCSALSCIIQTVSGPMQTASSYLCSNFHQSVLSCCTCMFIYLLWLLSSMLINVAFLFLLHLLLFCMPSSSVCAAALYLLEKQLPIPRYKKVSHWDKLKSQPVPTNQYLLIQPTSKPSEPWLKPPPTPTNLLWTVTVNPNKICFL